MYDYAGDEITYPFAMEENDPWSVTARHDIVNGYS